jgi:ferrous iron transport protein B
MIELPDYRMPSLRQALMTTWERALIFLRKAGTVILAISVVLWWLSSFPGLDESRLTGAQSAQLAGLRTEAAQVETAGDAEAAAAAQARADNYRGSLVMEYSFAGRLGRAVEPVLEPLGFNWQIGVGVISSFAAREVIVSTLSILYGAGGEEGDGLLDRMQAARRPDGSPVFTTASSVSLLVFFVLAMQCLPTQAVTRRETGQWRWAFLQLGYMTALAYGASLVAYQSLAAAGLG